MAHWDFENTTNDVGTKLPGQTVYNGTPAAAATYAASGGEDTFAMEFDGTSQDVDLPDGFETLPYGAGMTISVWAKMDPDVDD